MSNKPLPTDLELTALDPIFREHPHDRLDRLRNEDPVYLEAALGRLFLTRFEDMRAVLADGSLSKDRNFRCFNGLSYHNGPLQIKIACQQIRVLPRPGGPPRARRSGR